MTTSEGPRKSRATQRREHLLDTARRLFVDQGFHRTGVAQIAQVSGVKVGQIYRDFDSKEAIIAAICENDIRRLLSNERLFASPANDVGPIPIGSWIDEYLANPPSIDECRIMAEIVAEAGRNSTIAEMLIRIEGELKQRLGMTFQEIAPLSDPALRDDLIDLILATTVGLMTQRTVRSDASFPKLNGELLYFVEAKLLSAKAA